MKNYVISLSHKTDRQEHIRHEFGKQQIDFEFFDAVTPEQVPLLAKQFNINIDNANLTMGELACLFSHISLWQKCLDENLSHITIFEDDVYLGENLRSFLTTTAWLDTTVDVVKLEFFEPLVKMHKNALPVGDGRVLRELLEMHLGTAGYTLSKKACQQLLQKLPTISKLVAVDHIVFELAIQEKQLSVYQLNPALCVQSDRTYLLDNRQTFHVYDSSLEHDRRDRLNATAHIDTTYTTNTSTHQYQKNKKTLPEKIKREFMRVVYQFLNIKSSINDRLYNRIKFR